MKGSVKKFTLLAVAWTIAPLAASAQSGENVFSSACNSVLAADIHEQHQVCVVGVVENGTQVRVFSSNRADAIFKTVEVFSSRAQAGAEEAIDGLGQLKGQIVAIGGFDQLPRIYEGRLLSPAQGN